MATPTLIYLAARGRAELLRVVLAEAGIAYAERTLDSPEILTASLDELPFAAVPVWLEPDGSRLAQSMAIVRHVAFSAGLMGQTPRQRAQIDQMLGAYEDVRAEVRRLVATPLEG
jgi:glutathione S-transferase